MDYDSFDKAVNNMYNNGSDVLRMKSVRNF